METPDTPVSRKRKMADKADDREDDYEYLDLENDSLSQEDCSVSQKKARLTTKRVRQDSDVDDEDDDDEMMHKRSVANSQERRRMRRLNEALDDLRRCIPQQFHLYHRRLSKIRTLRLAVSYIGALDEMLKADDARNEQMQRQRMLLPTLSPTLVDPEYHRTPVFQGHVVNPEYTACTESVSCKSLALQTPPKEQPYHLTPGYPAIGGIDIPPEARFAEFKTPTQIYPYMYGVNTTPRETRFPFLTSPSPMVERRNPAELDNSYLSNCSDDATDGSTPQTPHLWYRTPDRYTGGHFPLKSMAVPGTSPDCVSLGKNSIFGMELSKQLSADQGGGTLFIL